MTWNVNRKAHRTSPEKSRLNRNRNLALDKAARNTRQVRRNFIFQRVFRLFVAITTLSSSRRSTRDTGSPTSRFSFPSSLPPSPVLRCITLPCVQLRRRRQVPIYKYKRTRAYMLGRRLRHTLQETSNNILVRAVTGRTSAPEAELNQRDVPRLRTPTFEYPRARLKFQNFSGNTRSARQTNYDKFSTVRASTGRETHRWAYPRVYRREFANSQLCVNTVRRYILRPGRNGQLGYGFLMPVSPQSS